MTVNISNKVRILLTEYLRSSSDILRTGGQQSSTVVSTLCQIENVELIVIQLNLMLVRNPEYAIYQYSVFLSPSDCVLCCSFSIPFHVHVFFMFRPACLWSQLRKIGTVSTFVTLYDFSLWIFSYHNNFPCKTWSTKFCMCCKKILLLILFPPLPSFHKQ